MASGKLALFDLDLTLIPFDSGMAWTQFLIGRGILPADAEGRYLAYCHEYIAGTLDIHAMHRANMQPLLEYSRATLTQWQQDFKREMAPRMPAWAMTLVKRHQDNGDLCAIVTATTELISEPIARLFDIDQLVATRPATAVSPASSLSQGGWAFTLFQLLSTPFHTEEVLVIGSVVTITC